MRKNKYNKTIYKIFMEDQKDHSARQIKTYNSELDWKKLTERDKKRQQKILDIYKKNDKKITGRDYFMMGIIFQHGTTIAHSKKAISFSKKGANLSNDESKWLYAAATDRLLIRQKKRQKFGTQYQKKEGKWSLYSIDPKTTDEDRHKYNVISLKDARAKAEEWNRQGINPWEEKRKTAGITSKSG